VHDRVKGGRWGLREKGREWLMNYRVPGFLDVV
jgi:hypothetical protein